jgi:hypothetical protein
MNDVSDDIRDELYELEESLWRRETRFDDAYMDHILADDFFEFGRSGRTYPRDEALSVPGQDIDIQLPLRDFRVHLVAEDVVLVTYVSVVQYDKLEVGKRSSLWVRQHGEWKLRFHQGTPAEV